METQKVLTLIKYEIGTILEENDKYYEVLECRELIPFLGEPEGFKTVIKEISKKVVQ